MLGHCNFSRVFVPQSRVPAVVVSHFLRFASFFFFLFPIEIKSEVSSSLSVNFFFIINLFAIFGDEERKHFDKSLLLRMRSYRDAFVGRDMRGYRLHFLSALIQACSFSNSFSFFFYGSLGISSQMGIANGYILDCCTSSRASINVVHFCWSTWMASCNITSGGMIPVDSMETVGIDMFGPD
jgi:hypothetical protein